MNQNKFYLFCCIDDPEWYGWESDSTHSLAKVKREIQKEFNAVIETIDEVDENEYNSELEKWKCACESA